MTEQNERSHSLASEGYCKDCGVPPSGYRETYGRLCGMLERGELPLTFKKRGCHSLGSAQGFAKHRRMDREAAPSNGKAVRTHCRLLHLLSVYDGERGAAGRFRFLPTSPLSESLVVTVSPFAFYYLLFLLRSFGFGIPEDCATVFVSKDAVTVCCAATTFVTDRDAALLFEVARASEMEFTLSSDRKTASIRLPRCDDVRRSVLQAPSFDELTTSFLYRLSLCDPI